MKINKIIDISRKISRRMAIWPGDDEVEVTRVLSLGKNDYCNLSSVRMSLHTGTHVDAPFHYLKNGADIGNLDLGKFIGLVKVFEIDVEDKCISLGNILSLEINEGDAVFFKTSNSEISEEAEFNKEYVYIDEAAARFLAEKGIRTVGIDYLSIDSFDSQDFPAHHLLLSAGVGVIEGLNLKGVEQGIYFFSALPLPIEGVEGSPVRAVLMEFEPDDKLSTVLQTK